MHSFIIRNRLAGLTLWGVAVGLFGAANALAAGTAIVSLRPTHVDLASATSRSAVLMTLSGYTAASAPRYRVYNGSNQYNPWDASSGTFIASTSYASNPTVPGDYVNGTAFWILYERGNNAAAGASYRDRLGTAYSANNNTIALPVATAMAAPFNLTGTLVAGGSYDLSVRYVILGFDSTSGGSLLCASFSDPTTGAFTLACNGGANLQRVEIRTITNTIITDATKTGSWAATTVLGNIDLSNSSTPPSFTSGINYSATSGVTMAFTVFATGSPTPELALESTTATVGSYSFAVATGVLDYTPPTNDVGTQTFTFTASNSAGVATQVVSVVVSDAPESAPVFSANPGPISTTVGVAVAFTISANGNPLPELALDGATATADSYSFTVSSGELSYTPPTNDVGARTFTFTASNSEGVATQAVSVTVAAAPITIPTVSLTDINTNSFTINWTACTDATNYQVQVATDTNFTAGTSGNSATLASTANTGLSTDWAYVNGANNAGNYHKLVSATAPGVVSAEFSTLGYAAATAEYAVATYGGAGANVLTVSYSLDGGTNWVSFGTNASATSSTYVTGQQNALPAAALGQPSVRIKWHCDVATAALGLRLQGLGVSGVEWAGTGSVVVDGAVTGLTYAATGLLQETLYFVRARISTTGAWSAVVSATTAGAELAAPWFTSGTSYGATVEVASVFAVVALGTPVPALALAGTTATNGGHSFTAETGQLSYTPPTADAGITNTFTLTASNSLGVVTQTVSVVVVAVAPSFGANPGPVAATATLAQAFTVTAAGHPAPILALQSQTASSGYSFTPATGVLEYTPPTNDIGAQTFTFTASNLAGEATQTVSVAVAAAPTHIPTVSVADINTNSFTINWTACTDATSYQVQVATDTNFTAGGSGANLVEEGFASAVPSGWTMTGVSTYSGLPYVGTRLSGTYSIKFDTTGDSAMTPAFGTGATNLQFWAYGNGGSGSSFAISGLVSSVWTLVDTVTVASNGATYNVALNPQTTQIKFSFTKSVNCALDDVIVQTTAAGGSIVADETVAALTYNATSLEMETTYHIRARQAGGEWSGVVQATTANPTPTAPFFDLNPGPIPTTAGVDVEFVISASGFPAPVLVLTNSTATADSYLFEPETGYFIYLPPTNDVGAQVFHFSATNTEGSATQVVTVNVAAATAPAFGADPSPLGATTGVARVFTVTATGVPVPVLALQSATATLGSYTFTSATGALSYTPPTSDVGPRTFTFTASNIAGVATQEVSVTVSKAPVLPTIDPLSALFIEVGQTSNLWVVAREADGDAITLFASNLPANASFTTANGAGAISNWFTFSPSSNQVGQTYAVDFYASDAEGSTFQTLDITVASDDPWKDYYAMCYSNGVLKTGDDLKSALHDIIAGHKSFSYTAATDILREIDECPTNSSMVQLLYLQYGRAKSNFGGGSGQWNREHVWAQSHGINGALPAYTDVHHLHPTDVTANSTRGSKDFDTVAGTPNSYSYNSAAFEPPDAGKGDVARAMFYMAVRYNGSDGVGDLELTNVIPTSGAKFGKLATLLNWNEMDPVNAYEIRRNDLIYSDYQKNRNPFVDHPEWARIVFDPTYVTPHTLTASTGIGGTISPASASVTNMGSQTFTITADAGYHIATILRNGVLVTPTNTYAGLSSYAYLWSNVTNDGTISATFVLAVPPLPAPASAWVHPTNTHSFTANWSSVGDATGYHLDIRGPDTSAVPGTVTALTEAFDAVTGNGGTALDPLLFPGWTFENVFAATNELRVGSSSKQGLVMTPAMDLGTTVTVSFAATRYGTDAPTVVVGLTNAGGAYVEQMVDVPAGGTNCTLVFTAGANGSQVIWKGNGASNQRFYLDDIEVSYWGVATGGAPLSMTGYPTNVGLITSFGVSNLNPSTEYEIYVAATDATRTSTWTSATVTTLDVVKSDQAIVFSVVAQQITTNLVTLVATADSGLPVSFEVASGPGAITGGNNLTFTGAGEVSIVASQAGNTEFNPAPDVTNVFVVTKAWAVITLGNLMHEYSGSNCIATVTVDPPSLAGDVVVAYSNYLDGSTATPVDAGFYDVRATVNTAMYQGETNDTLTVQMAVATVTLSGINQTYNGTARTVSATTDPAGLTVDFTYGGNPWAPTNVGTYAVTGTVNDVNFYGSATGSLVVSKAIASVTLGSLTQAYDGTPKSATAITVPTGLTVLFTYDGSATPPTAAGSYAVTGTVNDAIYSGEASGILVISAETLTEFQLWVRDEQGQSLSDPNFATDADHDGDGMTTWQEYLADTDPNSADSVLALSGQYFIVSASNSAGKIRMSFPASTSRYYQLVYSTNLTSPPLTNYLGQGVADMAIITNVPGTWYGTIRVLLTEP